MNWVLIRNSLAVSGGATLLAVICGFLAALFITSLSRPWRTAAIGVTIGTLALPSFVVTNCWLHLLGQTGVWRSWLPLNIMSLGGAICLLGLMFSPITSLAVIAAWRRLEPQWLESDMAVRGRHLLVGLLLPLCRGALLRAACLTFVLALNNFAVPAILQVKVYPAEVWIRFSTTFDVAGALWLSWPLVIAPLLLVLWLRHEGVSWPHLQNAVHPALFRRQLGKALFLGAALASLILFGVSFLLPIGELVAARRTWAELPGALAAGHSAVWNSFGLAAVSAGIVTVVGLFGASQRNVLLWLPFLVPGVLLGILLILVFNRPALSAFYSSAGIVVLAYVIRYFGPGSAVVQHARACVDPALVDVARLEGARRGQVFLEVELPQIAPQLAAAWYVVFMLCLWDVESMILIVPPGTETLALRIFNLLHYGHNPEVDALCLLVLALGVSPLALWAVWSRAGGRLAQSGARVWARLGRVSLLVPAACSTLCLMGCGPAGLAGAPRLQSTLFSSVQVIGTRGAGVGQLNKPRSVAVDLQDSLYVVDMTGRVQKFSPEGTWLLSWQMPQTDLGKPKGMCRDAAGNIVVLEPHYARVNHFTPLGRMVCQWGEHGTNAGQLSVPRAVGVNARDEIFLTEYQQAERIQKFAWNDADAKSGKPPHWVASFGKAGTGPGEFNRAEGLCVDKQGRVYVADSCNHRVQVFSADGQFLRMYGKPGGGPGELSYPYDVCVDPEGRQYVCEFGNSRIQVFDPAGRSLEIIGGPGSEPGRFNNPWGVALDSAGNLYVADSQNHRVQKLIRNHTPLAGVPKPLPAAAPAPAHTPGLS